MEQGDFFDDLPSQTSRPERPRSARGQRGSPEDRPAAPRRGGGHLRPHTPFVPQSYGPLKYKELGSRAPRIREAGQAGIIHEDEEERVGAQRRWSADSIAVARNHTLVRNQRAMVGRIPPPSSHWFQTEACCLADELDPPRVAPIYGRGAAHLGPSSLLRSYCFSPKLVLPPIGTKEGGDLTENEDQPM